MNCSFCSKQCGEFGDMHRCMQCLVNYYKNHISISTRIKNKTFVVVLYDNKTYIGSTTIPDMFEFDYRLKITPQNIKEKISSYLLFS